MTQNFEDMFLNNANVYEEEKMELEKKIEALQDELERARKKQIDYQMRANHLMLATCKFTRTGDRRRSNGDCTALKRAESFESRNSLCQICAERLQRATGRHEC